MALPNAVVGITFLQDVEKTKEVVKPPMSSSDSVNICLVLTPKQRIIIQQFINRITVLTDTHCFI